ncbi:hypothetical protein CDO52_17285 [Nocardiopsis gilva YIM 90087]|uniref:Uncharacterized protein n=1 Tax=Nocardiopsis gilva YIM 90087 TaxID=1235441 RepID=A0A223S867_9ACTN|nr:hypothetical protein [Nocardiopsis gilva]ASU84315.1 hypothetical protein CDO52_17285 [Nocardiopsis gilva YIM 90087]
MEPETSGPVISTGSIDRNARRRATGIDRAGLRTLAADYAPRDVRPLGVWDLDGSLLKVYAICVPGQQVDTPLLDRGRELAALRTRADMAVGALGLGTVILHRGGDGDYVIVLNWTEGFMSRTGIFTGPLGRPEELRPGPAGLSPCLWELAVIAHERDALHRDVVMSDDLDVGIAAWRENVLSGKV